MKPCHNCHCEWTICACCTYVFHTQSYYEQHLESNHSFSGKVNVHFYRMYEVSTSLFLKSCGNLNYTNMCYVCIVNHASLNISLNVFQMHLHLCMQTHKSTNTYSTIWVFKMLYTVNRIVFHMQKLFAQKM